MTRFNLSINKSLFKEEEFVEALHFLQQFDFKRCDRITKISEPLYDPEITLVSNLIGPPGIENYSESSFSLPQRSKVFS